MDVALRQGPAFGVGRLTLAANEPVRVEAGAMMAMSTGVILQAKAEGGITPVDMAIIAPASTRTGSFGASVNRPTPNAGP